jgi:branched-chain amino acid transport system permease protein
VLVALATTLVVAGTRAIDRYVAERLRSIANVAVTLATLGICYPLGKALLRPATPGGGGGIAGILLVLVLVMVACGLCGFLIERIAYRPLRKSPRLTVLITAIGVSLLLENGGQIVFGAAPQAPPDLIVEQPLFSFGSLSVTNIQAVGLGVSLALMGALQYVVFHTKLGTAMRAVSFSPTNAALMGIHTDRVISFTFMVGSALAGAAGLIIGQTYHRVEPLMGVMFGLKAFVAAVLGGIGNIPGAMVGGLLLGLSEEMVAGYVASSYRDAIAFALLIVILLFRPAGLFGKARAEKV